MRAALSNYNHSSKLPVRLVGILAIVCGLALAMALPPAAQAQEPRALTTQSLVTTQSVQISGTVNASSLSVAATEVLQLEGDTTLNLDANLACAAIESRGYDLTITGTKALTISNAATYGIEMRGGNLTIAGGVVSITTPNDCITAKETSSTKGHITISGGTVSLIATKDKNNVHYYVRGERAMTTDCRISIDNASVYCEGEISSSGVFGGIDIGSSAKVTVRTAAEDDIDGVLLVHRGAKNGNSYEKNARLQIDGDITMPAGGTVDQYVEVNTRNKAEDENIYNDTVVADGKAAAEVQINGGADPVTPVAEKTSIKNATVTGIANKTYTGQAITQSPTVKIGDATLEASTDYKLTYANNVNAGTATVTITGQGEYEDSLTWTFTIAPASLQGKALVLSKASYTYNGKVQKPAVKTVGGKALKAGTDYTVAYSNSSSKAAGSYTVTVTGKGNYTGASAKATYKINKAAISAKTKKAKVSIKFTSVKKKAQTVSNLTVAKGQGTVSYKNASTNKTAKKFKVNAKTGKVTVPKGTKKGSYAVKVKVTTKGGANYKKGTKTVAFTVKIA